MTVFLTGFMATGKSTVGALLARRLGLPFVDLDATVEAEAGASVAELFRREGEAGFRAREARALGAAAARPGVIALGGGALLRAESRALAQAAGPVVLLVADVEAILARLGDGRARPLLAGAPDPRARVEALLAERRAAYAGADLTIDTSRARPEATAEEIAAWIASR